MKNINWTNSIVTALISIAVTVIGGLVLFYFQNKEPKLTYASEKIIPFESQTEKLTIYQIVIENKGSSVAEDVSCKVSIEPALIKEYRVNYETPIATTDSLLKQEIDIKINSLNPKENIRVSILATTTNIFPEEPVVKLRAKGINGEKQEFKKPEEKKDSDLLSLLQLLLLASAMASTLTLIIRRKFSNNNKHKDDQNQVIAYLCGIHGLSAEVDRFLSLSKDTSYWAEMDRLTSLAVVSNELLRVQKTKDVITDLLEYADMASSSKGIGYYNLGRLEKFLGNISDSEAELKKAEKLIPKLLKTRLKLDPIFN